MINLLRHPLLPRFYIPGVLYAITLGMAGLVMPLYAADFDISYGLVGIVVASDAFGALLGDIPAGMRIRRQGMKRTLLLGLGGVGLTTMALYWVQSIALVVMLRLVTGYCRAMFHVAQHAFIAEAVSVQKRGRAIASYGGVFRLGAFIGPVVGGVAASQINLRFPFLITGGACAIAFALVIIYVESDAPRRDTSDTPPTQSPNGYLLQTLRSQYRVLAAAGLGTVLAQMTRAGRMTIIPLFAADILELDVDAIGLIVSLGSAMDMIVFPLAGYLMDKYGRKTAIVPCFAIQGLGMALVPLTGGFWSLLVVTVLMGFGNGLGSGTMMTLGSDLAPVEARGEFLGVWRLMGDAGFMGGPLAVGAIADVLVLPTAALAVAAMGIGTASVFGFLVPETLRKRVQLQSAAPE